MRRDTNRLLQIVEEIYYIKDLDTLLEKVLLEARNYVKAEAGTIYLARGRHLYFKYVQNEALFREDRPQDRYIYSNKRLLIDKTSLAGYVAATGDCLLIDDVYDLPSNLSYQFNPEFDKKTSYKTESILVVPLETTDHLILGVLQLINAKSEQQEVIPFSMQDRLYITEFARSAANAIEKAKLSKEMVLRMVEMAQLRDPYETSQHAKRVGAYSIELYKAWASRHGVEEEKVKQTVGVLHN
ncbi:MAG: GAF domain-containing protein, partial [Spirochaetales bacterium]|nr:GAF domain-containing protein [Spirochaetales bacterium]